MTNKERQSTRKYQKIPKLKVKSKKLLIKELDTIFSLYIRQRDNATCYTCGKQGSVKTMQNGHYISRSFHGTRWDEENCHCQCVGCNVYRNGNMSEYALRLINDYGVDILQELNDKKMNSLTANDLELLIEKYNRLI